jgi:hypothetical protein
MAPTDYVYGVTLDGLSKNSTSDHAFASQAFEPLTADRVQLVVNIDDLKKFFAYASKPSSSTSSGGNDIPSTRFHVDRVSIIVVADHLSSEQLDPRSFEALDQWYHLPRHRCAQ